MNALGRLAILISILLTVSACASIGAMRNPAWIRASLFKLTPSGSMFDEVEAAIRRKGLAHVGISREAGFYDHIDRRMLGESFIRATVGEHPAFPIGVVTASAVWVFDKERRLMDIIIKKETDSL